jgi:hypothetical protein
MNVMGALSGRSSSSEELVAKPLGVLKPLNLLGFHLPIIETRRIMLPISPLRN